MRIDAALCVSCASGLGRVPGATFAVAVDIARTLVLPAAIRYLGQLAAAGSSKGVGAIASQVGGLTDDLVKAIEALEKAQGEIGRAHV